MPQTNTDQPAVHSSRPTTTLAAVRRVAHTQTARAMVASMQTAIHAPPTEAAVTRRVVAVRHSSDS